MQDQYQKLQAECQAIATLAAQKGDVLGKDDVTPYLTACALKIWESNKLYAPEYSPALEAITGVKYSPGAILTAMSCCEGPSKKLLVPEFLKSVIQVDAKHNQKQTKAATTNGRTLVDRLRCFFEHAASINGDFTLEEADVVNDITAQLTKACDESKIPQNKPSVFPKACITPKKEEGYWQSTDQALQNGDAPSPSTETPTIRPEVPPMVPPMIPPTIAPPMVPIVPTVEAPIEPPIPVLQEEEPAVPQAKVSQASADSQTLESLLAELDSLVGLANVKSDVHSLLNFIKVCRVREQRGFHVPTISYHLVFTGNPGTGKTTVARLVAKLYFRMGLLAQGQLVEADRSTLVAGYLGQTAIKTQQVIQKALGGVLFIDEAYSLAGENDDSYGKEAIETLLKAMEDHRNELVVIVAGYEELMHQLIDSNPGLRSRFNKYFHFIDYTGAELSEIFLSFCKKNGYKLNEDSQEMLTAYLHTAYQNRQEHFGNARMVRNLFEKAINCQANRIAQLGHISDEHLTTLCVEDLQEACKEVE
ncbi:MAG: AAA family ATPase [Clostridia bacterium]